MSGAHNTARCYGTGKKTGAPVWPYDADYMRVTPTFREGSPCFVVLFIEGRKGKERQTERVRTPCLWMYYTAVTDGYVVPRGQSELWEDGFYFEVFPPIVHYCRELLPREAEVSKNGSRVFARRENRQLPKKLSIFSYLFISKINHSDT